MDQPTMNWIKNNNNNKRLDILNCSLIRENLVKKYLEIYMYYYILNHSKYIC